ncbi:hypothetical protein GUJ93_ZPchr0013g33841 [Zizania palustris]|uniref:Uncharacterized protein n=1 Tax=Zizania palustris TaxID=103762 RepID=A0A8J6C095_ZIZPA|nr:hypothetical protein GUJ93_ZPchr0013g33841 [Zizania palustris]
MLPYIPKLTFAFCPPASCRTTATSPSSRSAASSDPLPTHAARPPPHADTLPRLAVPVARPPFVPIRSLRRGDRCPVPREPAPCPLRHLRFASVLWSPARTMQ